MNQSVLNFALATDENFVIPALVCITSILENHNDNKCIVTVLGNSLSDEAKVKFQQLANTYKQIVNVVQIPSERFKALITLDRFPLTMYYRFLLPEILVDTDKVLYLDCDTMVRENLNNLFKTDLNNYACGVVIDQQCDDVINHNRLEINSDYFNSGVMLMNLKRWRDENYATKICQWIASNPSRCLYPDQDGLNKVLSEVVTYLPVRYNFQEMWLTMKDLSRVHFRRWSEIEKCKKNPAIVHFCVGDKPWFSECRNPYVQEYITYGTMHDFIGFKQRKHYSRWYWRIDAEIMRLQRWQKRFIRR